MNRKYAIILGAAVLFFAVNLFLIFKNDSRAARSSYITSWTEAKKEDMRETLETSGVTSPLEEHFVYFNGEPGDFKEFLVKKGDEVSSGTPLYEYSSDKIDNNKQKLETEKDQLVREANLIEEQIQQLKYLQSISSTGVPTFNEDGELEDDSSGEMVALSIEKEIYDKQLEKGRLLNEIKKYDETIDSLDDRDHLGINSDVEGTVKEINHKLQNPIMTIISATPKVEGAFSEADLKIVSEGMKARITSDLLKKPLKGTLTKIDVYPEKKPAVKKKSRYSYAIELEDEETDLFHGMHVNVAVITKESLKTVTVPLKSVRKQGKNAYVYILNDSGKVEKRKIERGIQLAGTQEAKKGVNRGELVITKPAAVQKADAPFFTPLTTDDLSKKTFKAETKMDIFKYVSIAFLKR